MRRRDHAIVNAEDSASSSRSWLQKAIRRNEPERCRTTSRRTTVRYSRTRFPGRTLGGSFPTKDFDTANESIDREQPDRTLREVGSLMKGKLYAVSERLTANLAESEIELPAETAAILTWELPEDDDIETAKTMLTLSTAELDLIQRRRISILLDDLAASEPSTPQRSELVARLVAEWTNR